MFQFSYIVPDENVDPASYPEPGEITAQYSIHDMTFEYSGIYMEQNFKLDSSFFKCSYKVNGKADSVTTIISDNYLYSQVEYGEEIGLLASNFAKTIANKEKFPSQVEQMIYEEIVKVHNQSKMLVNPAMEIVLPSSAQSATMKKATFWSESQKLPGVQNKVFYPCPCRTHGLKTVNVKGEIEYKEKNDTKDTIWSIIQHLNDYEKWSREKIADWLDELHDSGEVNLEFESWDENAEDEPVEDKKKFVPTKFPDVAFSIEDLKAQGWQEVGYIKDDSKVYLASPDALNLSFSIGDKNDN